MVGFPLQAVRQLACNKLIREWIWWGNAPSHYKHAYPLEPTPGEWCITPCSDSVTTPVADGTCLGEQVFQIKCTVAALLTFARLVTPKTALKGSKVLVLQDLNQQLHHANVAIAGLRETRMPQGQRVTQHYHVFASGCLQCGKSIHFGTEIWISKTIAVATDSCGQPIYLGKEKPTVLHADPRKLVLRFSGLLKLTVIAAHAPCLSERNSSEEVAQWWQDFCPHFVSRLMKVVVWFVALMLMPHWRLTALHSMVWQVQKRPTSKHVGFRSSWTGTKFTVPATLGCHTGAQHTWIHPKGAKLRRDYVLICEAWFPLVHKSRTIQDFDTGLSSSLIMSLLSLTSLELLLARLNFDT